MKSLMMGLLSLALFVCTHANAATAQRFGNINATGACQAPLPVYDQSLKKTPFVIRNIGTSPVFVSCSAQNHAYSGSELINVTVKNPFAEEMKLTCTLTEGSHSTGLADAYYLPKEIVIPPYSVSDMRWNAYSDNGGVTFFRVNFSCILPPGAEIGEISNVWWEDVGP